MIKKITTIALCLLLMLPQSSVMAGTVSEQELQQINDQVDALINGADPLEQKDLGECRAVLSQVYDAEVLKFLTFLEDNFSNKASNTSLTNVAIVRYTQFKGAIEKEFARLAPNGTEEDPNVTAIEFTSYQRCSEITDLYLEMGKDAMMKHIKATAAAKRTTVMLEKYKAINDKLNDLNFEISTMYSSFVTFKNKLPGFLTKCITQ